MKQREPRPKTVYDNTILLTKKAVTAISGNIMIFSITHLDNIADDIGNIGIVFHH